MKRHIEACETCAKTKQGTRVYSETGPRDATAMPWQEIQCDTIGPWNVELRARTLTFHAMTMVDTCTNLVEIKHTFSTSAKEGAPAVEVGWLSRYPRPVKIVTNQGPEFSTEFTDMCN